MAGLALPSIKRRGVSRLATKDPGLALKEAQSRSSMFRAIGDAVGTGAGLAAKYIERDAKRQMRDASLAVHEADRAFVASNRGREEFSVGDSEDENFVELADGLGYSEGDDLVPAHRVYPEWRNKNYTSAVEEAASKITNQRVKDEFLANHKAKGASSYAEDSVRATKDQIGYIARKTMANVEKSILNRDFGGARLDIELSGMSSEAKKRAMTDLDRREQTDYFNETIEKREVPVMVRALGQLNENDAKTTSEIDVETQKVLANQLRTAINVETNAIKKGAATNLKLQADDLKSQINDMWNGKPVDNLNMLNNTKILKEKYPVLVREARRTLAAQPLVSDVMLSSPSDQTALLQELTAGSEGGRNKSYLVRQLEKHMVEGQNERSKDTLKWANKVGFVALSPIDYSSPQAMQKSLSDRIQPTITSQGTYGTFTGFLMNEELTEFGNRLENAPDKLAFFQSINASMGEFAEPFYEQLKKYGVGETATMAGQLMAQGPEFKLVAENILKGAELRKTDTLTRLEMKDADLDSYIVENFGGMFAGNKKQQSLMAEAFKDVWAVTKDKKMAFDQVTGGAIDFMGSRIQPPKPGMGSWEYKFKISNALPVYWDTVAKDVRGFTGPELRIGILDGSLKQVGVGRGVTNLYAPNGSVVTKSDGVTPFAFSFDPDAPTKATQRAEDRAKAEAEFKAKKTKDKQESAARVQAMVDRVRKHTEVD